MAREIDLDPAEVEDRGHGLAGEGLLGAPEQPADPG